MHKVHENRSTKRTKKLMNDYFIYLLEQKSIDKITVKELTDGCNLNRGTFYLYYQDVYDMLEQLENQVMKELKSTLNLHNHNQQPIAIIEPIIQYIYDHQKIFSILVGEHGDIQFIHKFCSILKDYCFDVWKNIFLSNTTISQDYLKKYDYYFQYMIAGIIGVCKSWAHQNFNESPHEMSLLIESMIKEGYLCLK